MKEILESDPKKGSGELRGKWIKSLQLNKRNEAVAELALAGIMADPTDVQKMEVLLKVRVKALLALGKGEEALGVAKSLFNVASMGGTSDAVLCMAEGLGQVRKDDKGIIERFRREQMAGAQAPTTRPVEGDNAGMASVVPTAENTVMGSIKVDGKKYEEAVEFWTGEDYQSLVARGNLLLMADKAKEAKVLFERAYAMAGEKDLGAATENIARQMKAEDGTIGRANGWVLSLRPGK